MAVRLPNGVLISLGTTVAAEVAITAVSNANPAVATSVAHGMSDGDIIILESGWSRANERVYKVDQQTADTFEIEGLDSSSTTTYPAGTGTGTFAHITAWTQITQILGVSSSGGDQEFAEFSFMENDYRQRIPTERSPITITLEIADDPSLSGYIALKAASDARTQYAIRVSYPSGSYAYYYGYISLGETPTFTKNSVQSVQATISASPPVRYA